MRLLIDPLPSRMWPQGSCGGDWKHRDLPKPEVRLVWASIADAEQVGDQRSMGQLLAIRRITASNLDYIPKGWGMAAQMRSVTGLPTRDVERL